MFIKIVRQGRESVFECNRYSMYDLGERDIPTLMLEIRGVEDYDHEIPKDKDTQVYIMNSAGKTTDVLRWA